MTSDEIYTPLEQAREEIHRRWADRELRRRVEEFLGGVPPGVGDEPRAFLCRTVHTPNREFHRYMELASAAGLDPAPMEYLDDRFCNLNPDKLGLARMTFFRGSIRRGEPIIHRTMVTDGDIDGRSFPAISTLWGENLVGFHHRILAAMFPTIHPVNESRWFTTHGEKPKQFYPAHLARFICHGISFENYLSSSHEQVFWQQVVSPAHELVCSTFGMKPLVVRLLPGESANDATWTWYDDGVERLVAGEIEKITKSRRPR